MMNQYRERGFQRDRFQWAKCVVNYLVEAFSPNIVQLVVFLSEVSGGAGLVIGLLFAVRRASMTDYGY